MKKPSRKKPSLCVHCQHLVLAAFPLGSAKETTYRPGFNRQQFMPHPPVVAATHFDYYEQCLLKFAAYHEGRYLPKWPPAQSMGSRTHKAIEYYLRLGCHAMTGKLPNALEKALGTGILPCGNYHPRWRTE